MTGLSVRDSLLGFEVVDGDRPLALYRAREHLPRTDSPKPCFAPIYTNSGVLITEYRPLDHTWHTGLYFGWVHAGGANLWGGPWYLPEKGKYEMVDGTHGVQRHDGFDELAGAGVRERLTWLDGADGILAREVRAYRFEVCPGGYRWRLETRIEPAGERLVLGASRAARYSGLELRMGPPFAPGVGPAGQGEARHRCSQGREGHEAIMGQPARWVSVAGASGGMVALLDHPANPRHPVTWFARRNLLGAGLLMAEDLEVPAGQALHLRYRFLVLDDPVPPARLEDEFASFAADDRTEAQA